jgi:hypothetical protein
MGGRAFDNVVPIHKNAIIGVSAWVSALFELRKSEADLDEFREFYLGLISSVKGGNDDNLRELFVKNGLRFLGSTGKKEYSGDIDIAVSDKEWTYESLLEFLKESMGEDNVKGNGSLNQVYTRVQRFEPVGNGEFLPSSWHQIDFMVGDIELLEFTHWSPDVGTSEWSGSHRTELIKSVAKALSPWTLVLRDNHEYNPGEMIARLGYTLNHDKGLVHGGRFAPKRKDGRGYTKKMIPVTSENVAEFIEGYFGSWNLSGWESWCTEAEMITKVSMDPKFISQQLFGIGVMPESLNSYEQVVDVILANPELIKLRDLIWRLYSERLTQIGQPIPTQSLDELFLIRGLN